MPDVWTQVALELGKLLEPIGYRRSRLTFTNVTVPAVVRTIKIEKYRWNVGGDLRFQLILGIYLATGEVGEFAFKGAQSRYSIVFLQNAGVLWGDPTQLCQVPTALTQDAFDPIRADVETRILPFLERCDSVDAVIRALDEAEAQVGWRPYSAPLAIALARLGRVDEARELFRRAPGDPEMVRTIAAQSGIEL